MTAFAYWIQHADFSADDYSPVDVEGAVGAFLQHDWVNEQKMSELREQAGSEVCDFGIGFDPNDGRVLHICPLGEVKAYFHYHFQKKTRWLSLIPRNRQVVRSNMEILLNEVPEIIRRFYAGDHEWMLRRTTV